MIFERKIQKDCIMNSLPKTYKYVYISSIFMMSVYGDIKAMLVHFPPKLGWLCRELQHNTFLKIAALTTGSFPSEYHGGCNKKEVFSLWLFVSVFELLSFLASLQLLRVFGAPLLIRMTSELFIEIFKTFCGCLRNQFHSLIIINSYLQS